VDESGSQSYPVAGFGSATTETVIYILVLMFGTENVERYYEIYDNIHFLRLLHPKFHLIVIFNIDSHTFKRPMM
jgi:hypothetical protein